jgi:hypothetical protein
MAYLGKAGSGDQADISGSYQGDFQNNTAFSLGFSDELPIFYT